MEGRQMSKGSESCMVASAVTCYLARLTLKSELVRDCPVQPLLVLDHFLN